jgi:lipid-A-disaccharide synthase
MPQIAYVAGEASGDRHAAALHRALLAAAGGAPLTGWGIGGSGLRAAGVEVTEDSSHWGAIGIISSLCGLPMYGIAMRKMKSLILARKPDAVILVDFGFFNVRLARWLKEHGIGPVIFYQPPGSWKKTAKPESMRELGQLTDLIVTPFPWSNDNLRAVGANSHWEGHPLVDIARPSMSPADFDAAYGLDARRPIIALLPGSRRAEVTHLLPMLLRAATVINRRVPGTQFLLAAAPNLDRAVLERMLEAERERANAESGAGFRITTRAGDKLRQIASSAMEAATPNPKLVTNEGFLIDPQKESGDDEHTAWKRAPEASVKTPTLAIVENLTYDCMSRADVVISCSGTATLEAAILDRPTIIVYKVSRLMAMEYHLRKNMYGISYVGLPNIIAGEKVMPELLQDDASPEAVAEMAVGLLIDPEKRKRAVDALAEKVHPALGTPGVIDRSAALIWSAMKKS